VVTRAALSFSVRRGSWLEASEDRILLGSIRRRACIATGSSSSCLPSREGTKFLGGRSAANLRHPAPIRRTGAVGERLLTFN
jgi:hypothetical protein